MIGYYEQLFPLDVLFTLLVSNTNNFVFIFLKYKSVVLK